MQPLTIPCVALEPNQICQACQDQGVNLPSFLGLTRLGYERETRVGDFDVAIKSTAEAANNLAFGRWPTNGEFDSIDLMDNAIIR